MGRPPKPKATPPKPNDIAAKAEPFIKRLEFVDGEKAESNAQFAEEKKIIFEEAERAGLQPKPLKLILRRRKAQRAEEAALEKFDIDEKAPLNALADAFGDDSPFGAFARLRAAGATVTVHQATSTMEAKSPAEIDPVDAENREDEALLRKLGRGGKPGDDIDGLAR